jgi:uncharacterized protein YcbK (DUF882 family)
LARRFGAIALALIAPAILGSFFVGGKARAEERRIELHNIHTKEDISIVYKRDGKFIPDALDKLNHFMRDWRRDKTVEIDPDLFDLIWDMHRELGSKKPVNLICGHRSGKTNEMLRKTRGGQAKASKHITGQAADIQFPDIPAKQLRNSALIREKGGVGYYPTSAIPFVHVDTGRVRSWPRLPRQELALLFPSGRSKHVPADGRPITKKDFQVALANLQRKGEELPFALRRHMQGGEARTVVASLPQAEETPAVAVEPKPKFVYASLAPFSGAGSARDTAPAPLRKPEPLVPSISGQTQQTAARADADSFRRDFLKEETPEAPDTVPDDQMAGAPDYDEDHPDELDYQPFPVLPLMADTPVASMDMSGEEQEPNLQKVHMLFGEPREMLHSQFQPGLQYAQLYWAQKFQGTAINTELKRVARDEPAEPAPAEQNTRTARK